MFQRFLTVSLLGFVTLIALDDVVSAQDPTSTTRSNTRSSSHIRLVNTPLVEAIGMIAQLTDTDVIIDSVAVDAADIDLDQSVSIAQSNVQARDAIESIIPDGLICLRQDDALLVTTRDPSHRTDADQQSASSRPGHVRDLRIRQALERSFPIHLEHAPLDIALNMIGGMVGQRIEIRESVRRKAGIGRFELITIHRDHSSLGECLESILDRFELKYEIVDGQVTIRQR